MVVNREDKVVWLNSRNNKFLVKSSYVALEPKESISFPISVIWNSLVSSKVSLLHLGR